MQVFYRPEQSVFVRSSSPSAGKPAPVVADWQARFGARIELVSFDPVTREDFHRVHDRGYVDAVFSLEKANGFGTRQADVVEALRYTSGSMRAAALAAWRGGGITVSPTSGFHHANHAHGGGFCTFNGLVLAALAVLESGAEKLAIIDCDYHYGDGTESILDWLGLGERVQHWTLGGHHGDGESEVLDALRAAMEEAVRCCELVIYQAGADSHQDDPLGGVFTTAGYRERERLVFGAVARAGVPLAWNLAGGYQEPLGKVLALHAITMEEALAAETRFAAPGTRRLKESSTGEVTRWEP
jgi:acetoin utilization deacetylase AcuC-like enzyme